MLFNSEYPSPTGELYSLRLLFWDSNPPSAATLLLLNCPRSTPSLFLPWYSFSTIFLCLILLVISFFRLSLAKGVRPLFTCPRSLRVLPLGFYRGFGWLVLFKKPPPFLHAPASCPTPVKMLFFYNSLLDFSPPVFSPPSHLFFFLCVLSHYRLKLQCFF